MQGRAKRVAGERPRRRVEFCCSRASEEREEGRTEGELHFRDLGDDKVAIEVFVERDEDAVGLYGAWSVDRLEGSSKRVS